MGNVHLDLDLGVLALAKRSLKCRADQELRFLLLNDSRQVFQYRQAALWSESSGVEGVSGVMDPESTAPYIQFLNALAGQCATSADTARAFVPAEFSGSVAAQWNEFLPECLLWIPFGMGGQKKGLLIAREGWPTELEIKAFAQWAALWASSSEALAWRTRKPLLGRSRWTKGRLSHLLRNTLVAALLLAVALIPVRLTILAPGELVPARAEIIRAPMDGTLGEFFVEPNQQVRTGDVLFQFDQSALLGRLKISRQELATARAEYRQAAQRALSDQTAKALLAPILGRIEQHGAEAEYLAQEVRRSTVQAPSDGFVLMDEPSEWLGKPVVIGEKILRLARLGEVEVEAWVSLGDAIPLPPAAPITLYPNTSPLRPVQANLRYFSHEAQPQADGSYAYRMRATPVKGEIPHRVGTKGTTRISGKSVPLVYWLLRRPLAYLRAHTGW